MKDGPQFPERGCPACGKLNDASSNMTGPEEALPNPGDISVCLYCGYIAVIADDGVGLREPNLEEARAIAGDPFILVLQAVRAETMAKKAAEK